MLYIKMHLKKMKGFIVKSKNRKPIEENMEYLCNLRVRKNSLRLLTCKIKQKLMDLDYIKTKDFWMLPLTKLGRWQKGLITRM